jgi:membrane protease YdiL (CAAX protease family)
VTAVTRRFSTPLTTYVAGDVALAAVTLVAVARRWPIVRDSICAVRFSWRFLALIVAASVPIFLAVEGVVRWLAHLFDVIDHGYLSDFRNVHVGWAYVVIAVDAALFEELAFRGVIYTILRKYIGLTEAVVVTSFAFAILHLSVLGLLTHVALGAYFCWLRERTGSVYPSMLAHALHNALVLLDEQLRWSFFS